ncbi:protocadherin beta-6-like [Mya arenaria]|uniref:protocadherin beta-6-like n=1 Tax=Mya arenaria TaxID=6604 RepID=UPI0022E4A794|nr:protocadherin beta-6-like [Mya arenaria]XP_052793043.1 protocadherin beta-6-like [Mya arenaria]
MESAESLSCFVCVFAYLINYSDSLLYSIPEALPQDHLIGNIAKDYDIRSKVSEENFRNLEYFFLDLEAEHLKYFSIDSKSSDLKVNEPMDYETVCQFSSTQSCTFILEVASRSSLDTSFLKISVTIELLDINDNPPKFSSTSVTLQFSESDVVGTKLPLDRATDSDSANFSVGHYELQPIGVPFHIEEIDDELNLVLEYALDRETVSAYLLELIAFDKGEPPLNGSIVVNVDVLDANDNKPKFSKEKYTVTINENVTVNEVILTVNATDKDLNENAEIFYSISTNQAQNVMNKFAVNETTGDVYIKSKIVYTSDEPIKVTILAKDGGARPQTASVIVEVTVEDSVNVQPEISLNLLSTSGSAEASEYASIGSVVAYFKVFDPDGGRNGLIDCTVESEQFEKQGLDSKEYKVIVISPLDREVADKHNVSIVCHDLGVPQLSVSANFTVDVLDENDNAPKFTQESYESSIKENNNEGYAIVQVHAKDADEGKNADVAYYIDPSNRTDFDINALSGLITASKSFDREERSEYKILVTAVDSGNPQMSSSIIVTLTIQDENDNSPVFEKEIFEYYIPESDGKVNTVLGTVLGKITATDSDLGGNAYVMFSMVGNLTEMPFDVLPDGTVKTKSELDREQNEKYIFQVMAIDNGREVRRSSVVNVTVHVTDINDNYPFIVYPNDESFVKRITYQTPAKTQIMKIDAKDNDFDKNAALLYRINSRNDSSKFEIGRQGEILVARRLEETDIDTYFLDISVSDQGNPPKSTSTIIRIEVLAKNVTAVAAMADGKESGNIVIAAVVISVTVVFAIGITVIIFLVKRRGDIKRKFFERPTTVQNSSPDRLDNFAPTVLANGNTQKVFHNGHVPRLLPTAPSPDVTDSKPYKDVKFQETVHVREKSFDSTMESTHEQQTVEKHRLASLRLQQAFIQNSGKQWTSQSELPCDMGKDGKRQEDHHSDLSAETATYDSGMGGSVSDTGDIRLNQLQQIVRQSGRRGKPPHKSHGGHFSSPTNAPKIIARGHSNGTNMAPERPPPLKNNPYRNMTSPHKMHSATTNMPHLSPPISPVPFITSSPTPCSMNQNSFITAPSPTKYMTEKLSPTRHSPSKNTVQDLLMYKNFQNGLRHTNRRQIVDESVDTTQFDDDDSTTSGSYYIDNTVEDWKQSHPPISDIYV